MCKITKSDCYLCPADKSALYTFDICRRIQAVWTREHHNQNRALGADGFKYFCEDLVWPPLDDNEVTGVVLCDDCLLSGAKDHKRMRQAMIGPGADKVQLAEQSRPDMSPTYWPHRFEDVPDGLKYLAIRRYEAFEGRSFPGELIPAYSTSEERDRMWAVPLRQLTLWIPCCQICKKVDFNLNGGAWGIEAELNSILWEQVGQMEVLDTNIFSTHLRTGFLNKPCRVCYKRESLLQDQVRRFLDECTNHEAWAVWHWLMGRGSGVYNFWHHEVLNVGFASGPPPVVGQFISLMGQGWQAKAGSSWGHWVDHLEPVTCPYPAIAHRRPFTQLSQWNLYAAADVDASQPKRPVLAPAALVVADPENEGRPNLRLSSQASGLRATAAALTLRQAAKHWERGSQDWNWIVKHRWLALGERKWGHFQGVYIDDSNRAVLKRDPTYRSTRYFSAPTPKVVGESDFSPTIKRARLEGSYQERRREECKKGNCGYYHNPSLPSPYCLWSLPLGVDEPRI